GPLPRARASPARHRGLRWLRSHYPARVPSPRTRKAGLPGRNMKAYDIRPLASHNLPAFFSYLERQLADNGQDGTPLFQPQPRGHQGTPEGRRDSFTKGLTLAVGEPGWRRAWLALDGDS